MKISITFASQFAIAMFFALRAEGQPTATKLPDQTNAAIRDSKAATAISWADKDIGKLVKHAEAKAEGLVKRGEIDVREQYSHESQFLYRSLNEKFSNAQLHQLAASFASASRKREEWTTNQLVLWEALLGIFLANGDREGLVTLLSQCCFREVSFSNDIEFVVAANCKKLSDPVLVLGDAYAKCTGRDTKRDIAAAVRRAFRSNGISGNDDAEFVKNAMAWYRLHRGNLVINDIYWHNFNDEQMCGGDPYAQNPLFVLKDPRRKPPAKSTASVSWSNEEIRKLYERAEAASADAVKRGAVDRSEQYSYEGRVFEASLAKTFSRAQLHELAAMKRGHH